MFRDSDRKMQIRDSAGFSLIEVVIAMGLGIVVLMGALVLTGRAVNLSDLVTQKSDMQQNGRVAINWMSRDLSLGGTGIPAGGIQLPSGDPSVDSVFACDQSDCYVTNNSYPLDRMFAITPGDGKGPNVKGAQTDVVTTVYSDTTSQLNQFPLVDINDEGTRIVFDAATDPVYDDPIVGLRIGDVLILTNANGSAAALVTEVRDAGEVLLSENDVLHFNQPDALFGNVKTILSPPPAPDFPPTFAYRIQVITYYIDATDMESPVLMRQVNGHEPIPVAENVEDLQITYDIFDESAGVATADLSDAGGVPNQIRKVNMTLLVRSAARDLQSGAYQRTALATSVGPRNLTYRDRYE